VILATFLKPYDYADGNDGWQDHRQPGEKKLACAAKEALPPA
jgi:hypothetical protein